MNTAARERVPVIVAIGEYLDKPRNPAEGREPVELLQEAVLAADRDGGGGWLRQIDTIRVVDLFCWAYRNLPELLALRLRIRGAEHIQGPIGGETPVRMMLDAALDIVRGQSEVSLLCGAEAVRTMGALLSQGRKPAWSDPHPSKGPLNAEDHVSRLAADYGLSSPVAIYPLYENACRAHWQQSFAESQAESGLIFAKNSEAAARNPYSWSGRSMSAEEVVTPSKDNRPLYWPYQKYMVANVAVNQAAAVIVTTRERALAMGVPEDQLVYIWSGAGAHEPYDFLQRAHYQHSPALELVLQRTLALNGLAARDLDLFELYSCFPIVPKLARRVLGLAADAQTSVCGGLTMFGGPGNNYMTHAITAMVRALRAGEGRLGLLHGNGEFVTKHHAAVLARRPPTQPLRNEDLQAELEAQQAPAPALLEDYSGPARIETYTVSFTPGGKPDRGIVLARTPDGQRVVTRVTELERDTLQFLIDGTQEAIGREGHIYDGNDGWLHFGLQPPAQLPPAPVRFERHGAHIAVITLDRPEKRNAVNAAVTRLLARYVRLVDEDPQIRVAILQGAGGKVFCAGADLGEIAAGRGLELNHSRNGFAGFVNAKRIKPWIAAVSGSALGGGTELSLACDLTVATRSASFGLPEVKRSLIAAAGGLYRLPRSIPPRVAMAMILSGEAVGAEQALSLGLINELVDEEQLSARALALAQSIADNAPLAVQASRLICASAFEQSDAELAQLSGEKFMSLLGTADFAEGPRAFLEKRKPVWQGR